MRAGQAIVRIVAAGLCHSDLGVASGGLPFPLPGVLGHEGAGIVERVGTAITSVFDSRDVAGWMRGVCMTMSATDPSAGERGLGRASLLYAVKRVELAVRSHLDELLRPIGITALQYTAMTVLERHDGLPAAQLARDSFVTAQSMADMVRTLEKGGLIVRERNSRNRRELLIHLTDAGRQVLAGVADQVAELEQKMISSLTPDEADNFRLALTRAWHALS